MKLFNYLFVLNNIKLGVFEIGRCHIVTVTDSLHSSMLRQDCIHAIQYLHACVRSEEKQHTNMPLTCLSLYNCMLTQVKQYSDWSIALAAATVLYKTIAITFLCTCCVMISY